MRGTTDRTIKRIADFCVALAMLAVLWPLLILVGILIRLTSPGPAIYKADRIGKGGRPFKMWKFRSMVTGADKVGPSITAGDDPRITPIGALLRRTKIDELPQLVNILKGEMSFVGPRPQVQKFVEKYSEREMGLLKVDQGLTDYSSLWFRSVEKQLSGSEDAEQDYETRVAPTKIALGLYYVKHATIWADFKLFIGTALAVLFRANPSWCFPPDVAEITKKTCSLSPER